jgi:hypothetical protein
MGDDESIGGQTNAEPAADTGEDSDGEATVRLVRTISGGLVIAVILILVVGETFSDATIADGRLLLLVSLAGALLGVDIARRYMPLRLEVTNDEKQK